MTLRELITAYCMVLNLTSQGRTVPNGFEFQSGVKAFNAMWRAYQGRIIGQRLARVWTASAGDTACAGGLYAVNVHTPAEPANGTRIGVIGARTVTATDGTIEGAASVVTTASTTWFYREDLGDWIKERDLTLDDNHPFCAELDEALPFMVAARLTDQFGKDATALIQAGQNQGEVQLREIYGAKPVVRVARPLLRGVGRRWPC